MTSADKGGVFFLVCPDAQLIRQEIDARLAEDVRRKVYWADDDPPLDEDFWTNLTIKGLFAEPKALILRRSQALLAAHWDTLGQAAPRPGSDVTLFLCLEGAWQKNAPAVPAVLKKRALWTKTAKERVWQSPGLTRKNVRGFVDAFAKERGLSFAPGAPQAVSQALPLDARAARLELEKIALAAGDGPITPALADLVAPHEEMDFFAFLDQLQAGRADQVWTRVLADHRKPSSDRMLFPLLASVAREARVLGLIASGEEQRVRLPGFVMDRKRALARSLGRPGVAALLDLAMRAEHGVKSGEQNVEQALELLAAGLMDLYRGARSRR